jgi:N-carbamoylputrescine amidase
VKREASSTPKCRPKKNIVTLGLIQMRCSPEPRENLAKALARVAEAADRICLQELFTSVYFCQVEDHKYFGLAEEIPGPSSTEALSSSRGSAASSSSPRFSKSARRGFITTPRPSSTRMARYLGKYRKMHIPDDPLFYEKFYFTPGDLGFLAWKTRTRRSACASAGTSGIRRRRGSPRCAARKSFFIPPPSAGIPASGSNMASGST